MSAAALSGARLGVDIGGTRLKLGLVADATVIARRVLPVDMHNAAALVAAIAAAARDLAAEVRQPILSVGVGVPGVLGVGGSPVLQSPNLPWLDGVDLQSRLAAALNFRAFCDNDANCVGWGEAIAGAGRGRGDQLCLVLGTGVGGSLVTRGKLEHGSRGRGIELGHICVEPGGAPCGCGGQGCLEQYASQTGLLRMMGEVGLPAAGPDDVRRLFDRAAAHEPRAAHVVAAAGAALGRAIAGLTRLTGVRCVIFAGGIAGSLPAMLPSIERTLTAFAAPSDLRLIAGTLQTDAGIIGAAHLGVAPR